MNLISMFTKKYEENKKDKEDAYWLSRVTQELGELSFVIHNEHRDPVRWVAQIASICINWYKKKTGEAVHFLDEFQEAYPRATHLMLEGKDFICIKDTEPYYIQAYEMIREHEVSKGTWTAEDERIFIDKKGTFYEEAQ